MRALPMFVLGLSMAAAAMPAFAQDDPPSLRDSFPLGDGNTALCQVQTHARDAALTDMFDRAWTIVCRDAARPVGKIYALRGDLAATEARLAPIRAKEAVCSGSTQAQVADLGTLSVANCKLKDVEVGYHVYSYRRGPVTYVAEGLAGYDDALKLGLRTIVADRIIPGKIQVAITSGTDPVAFARVQAGSLDPEQALAEGYRRNNAGDYAEAAEFFGVLSQKGEASADRTGEYLINEALQKSDLGQFAEADRLFAEANKIPTTDRVQARLRRNFEAIHQLNQGQYDLALQVLERPVAPLPPAMRVIGGAIEIAPQVAAEINAAEPVAERLGTTESGKLTPEERAQILDAQALQLRGTLMRLKGEPQAGLAALEQADARAEAVRQGRVVSILRFRAQTLAETGAAYEALGDFAKAEDYYRRSIALLEQRYPETTVMAAARARLAAFLARRGRADEALALYKTVVDGAINGGTATTGISNLLAPYFATLVERAPSNPALVGDFFTATQTLVRPGVADTQAQLARELSSGAGEAASLFRQATMLAREVERTRIELATERSAEKPDQAKIDATAAELDRLTREQAATQAKLAPFPQYRALSTDVITLADLQATLRPDEAYWKLAVVGPTVYGLYVTKADATAYKLPISSDDLDAMVDDLRATISTVEDGQVFTYPFDVAGARKLYVALAGPVADRLPKARHLIFEPDGAMLRLPVNLLVTDQAGVDRYLARTAVKGADKFDFTGVAWLGRSDAISTAVSARGFRDTRKAPLSAAKQQYIGFGHNAPAFLRVSASTGTDDCQWPLSEWNKPISAAELYKAQSLLGEPVTDVVTGPAFTDEAVMSRPDLADYRIVHFATHGFVTAPRSECPARPALLTSFGDAKSDGLLTFREIYDLKLDADLVILSACDTAGKATIAATREAGVTTGGGTALDGLVRAFIGAGGRTVLASHWPAPDEFNATQRLISGLFEAPAGTPVADALHAGQVRLMDDPRTSHPFYWAGFALVGDGAQPLLRAR